MALTQDDFKRVCFEVRRFSKIGNLRWKALPVVAWEFASVNDMELARLEILQALQEMMATGGQDFMERAMGQGLLEIDCYGVTFRLITHERRFERMSDRSMA